MKLAYWVSTTILCTFLLWSAYTYLYSKQTIEGIRELGFPDFFRLQLAVLKIIAVAVLLVPQIPTGIKEWAYAGVGLFFITAIVAHFAHKDPIFINLINLVLIAILIISYVYLHKIKAPF
ncbi:DoxX family protein [Aquimarina gracilis]|uniref:DoxX family protein n=1 Tax=Aquimarina gracilis TaxID=874422 RepID=A0ABU5ZWB6_9FLAO|nr:DoxX family protein [Aquimarina gracilis]MEB3346141.1 DoxX family protein [Aquimarina gracilis]